MDSKTRKKIVKRGDAFFKGMVNAGDSAVASFQNGVLGGIKKHTKVKPGYKPYLTVSEKQKAPQSKKKGK